MATHESHSAAQTETHGTHAEAHGTHGGTHSLQERREHLKHGVEHFCHMLSEQGPLCVTFVHNNTLLGLQKLHFEEAIAESYRFQKGQGYWPNERHRGFYAVGRINDDDINVGMKSRTTLSPAEDEVLATVGGRAVTAGEVYRAHLIHGIAALDPTLLRHEIEDKGATRSFRRGVPEAARAALLSKAASELAGSLARVGRDWTLAHWLQAHTNLDVPGRLRARVLYHLFGDHAATDEEYSYVDSSLRALGIPVDRSPSYLTCIDRQFDETRPEVAQQRERIRGLWLREEAALLETLARRHWGISGTFSAFVEHFRTQPEGYAVLALWHACLAGYGLEDPLSPTDPYYFQEQDPEGGLVEALAERFTQTERWGGPPIPLTAELRHATETVVKRELELLRDRAEGGDTTALGAAHLCWIVLHDLGPRQLNRRGLEALEALLSLQPGRTGSADLSEQLRQRDPRRQMLQFAQATLEADLKALGHGSAHSDFLRQLTGEDVVDNVNRYMIKLCGTFMDEGLTAWHMPGRALGFYEAWRTLALQDRTFDFDGLTGWRDTLHHLPALAEDAIIHSLEFLGVEDDQWDEYLGRVLVRLKGWAGLVFWYQLHPHYPKQSAQPIDTLQYLAVRLFYETLLIRNLCKSTWQIEVSVGSLRAYFQTHLSEFFVRRELYADHLPEYLAHQARTLVAEQSSAGSAVEGEQWTTLADMIWMSRESMEPRRQACGAAWRLFHLAQVLGLSAGEIRALSAHERDRLLGALDAFPESAHGPVWLIAFERHYRDEFLNALALNRGKGRWRTRDRRPKAQVYYCIDEREEAIHRHTEELDPEYETLGAAGFFGMAMDYTGLDDHGCTPLCPAVVTPAHQVLEVPRPEEEHGAFPKHKKRAKWLEVFHDSYWETKRNLVSSYFLIDLVGFIMALPLLGRILFRNKFNALMVAGKQSLVPPVRTQLVITRTEHDAHGHGHGHNGGKPIGFTDVEQADRLEALLRNTSLTYQFARLVVVAGHGSFSMNNPHENAHDCGACGGKHGFANARVVAAIANRPAIRALLRTRGIDIPDDTWFIGAIHNTCHEGMTYADLEDIPATHAQEWQELKAALDEARTRSAHERCRRFGSSPKDASNEASLKHIEGRSMDLSQVRPEWGHATNGFAVVGRRAVTQGVFFDRRPFVISYDATQDPTGKILERILLAVGPVGAGINLEYYFSTVDPKVYGSDTKVPHNVTGLIGVMAGAHSDLQTGLPLQMTEVHEAMRLQLLVEAPMAILGEIYGRQPGIQQLLNGQWVHLIAVDPETGAFNMFVPGVGFVLWDEPLKPIPTVKTSAEWYRGHYECFLPPAFVTEPTEPWTKSKGGAHV